MSSDTAVVSAVLPMLMSLPEVPTSKSATNVVPSERNRRAHVVVPLATGNTAAGSLRVSTPADAVPNVPENVTVASNVCDVIAAPVAGRVAV